MVARPPISGNQIIQGGASQNYKMVDYGEEGLVYTSNTLLVSGNSFTSSGTPSATAIYDPNCVTGPPDVRKGST